MSIGNRELSYSLAINETLHQIMAADRSVLLIGQGVKSPWYVSNTTRGLLDAFGPERVIDTPVSENAVTGIAVGAAIAGMKSVVVHPRMDFMLYALDPIVNEAANWHYMFGGRSSVPVVIWGIVNRGGEQAAQHSQALHAFFTHVPGVKVIAPSTPHDVKGLLASAIRDENPVFFMDDRWLYPTKGKVPEELYSIPIGEGVIRRAGSDVTVVATSYLVNTAIRAAALLEQDGITAEVIDPRSLKPLDRELIYASVRKTGRLVIVDTGWKTCGVSAEISAVVSEDIFESLRAPIVRVTLPDTPAPASGSLEKGYYPDEKDIIQAVKKVRK